MRQHFLRRAALSLISFPGARFLICKQTSNDVTAIVANLPVAGLDVV